MNLPVKHVSSRRGDNPNLTRAGSEARGNTASLRRVAVLSLCGAAALAAAVWVAPHPAPPRHVVDFQSYRFGVAPAEFDYDATGPHGPALAAGRTMWRTYADSFAPSPTLALIQASSLPRLDHYPLALLRDVIAADLMTLTYVKPMGGDLSQSAGLVWRVRDRDNYYAALLDAREGRVRLVRITGGRPQEIARAAARIQVEFERRVPSRGRGWYLLRVEAVDDRIQIWVDGDRKLSVRDGVLRQAGRAGLITHGDAVALFDDFEVQTGRGGFVLPRPRSRPDPLPPPKMHVAEVASTDALYREPTRAFSGDQAYWRVAIRDPHGNPVPAARVHVDVVGPDGAVRARPVTMTGSDGLALFHYPLREDVRAGVYTVRVTGVSHADRSDALYDSGANVTWSTSFSVRRPERAGTRSADEVP